MLRGGFLQPPPAELPPAGPPIVRLTIGGLAPGEPTVPEDAPAPLLAGEVTPLLFPWLFGLFISLTRGPDGGLMLPGAPCAEAAPVTLAGAAGALGFAKVVFSFR